MKNRIFAVAGILLAMGIWTCRVWADDAATQEQAAIQKTAAAFVDAFQSGDAKAVAAFWTPDGDYVDQTGRMLKGRQAIEDEFTQFFAENKGLKVHIEVGSRQLVTADVAVEDGVSSVMAPDGSPPSRAAYTNVLVKKDGQWLLSSVREAPYVPPSNYDHLRQLEWMIGDWAADDSGGQVARVSFAWSPDMNFIISTRAVQIKDVLLDNGSQRIGWDPSLNLIRAWNFETDGGFGESSWAKDGDKWTVTASSVLQSGGQLTATNVVTRVDADTCTWQVTNQRLNGQPLPDSVVVTMKRVKQP